MNRFFQIIFFIIPLTTYGQVDRKTVSLDDSLRIELKRATLIWQTLEKKVDRLTYLLAAKEMALRSTELADSTFQSLVAVQAFNFNKNHEGDPADIDIYRALQKALERHSDSKSRALTKKISKTNIDLTSNGQSMADELCTCIKRNMTIDEWNKFSSQLKYEKTCGTTK